MKLLKDSLGGMVLSCYARFVYSELPEYFKVIWFYRFRRTNVFTDTLEAAIETKLKEREKSQRKCGAQSQIDAYIPSDYISDERQKIEIYRRIREFKSKKIAARQLIDRFGGISDVVAYL